MASFLFSATYSMIAYINNECYLSCLISDILLQTHVIMVRVHSLKNQTEFQYMIAFNFKMDLLNFLNMDNL